MSVRDYYRQLEKDKKIKNKRHLDFNFSNLDEDELIRKLLFIFEDLNDYDIENVNFSFSCDYWESECSDEEDS